MQPRPAWGWQQWLKLHTGQTSGTWEPSVSGASASSGVHQALSEHGTSLALFQPLQAKPRDPGHTGPTQLLIHPSKSPGAPGTRPGLAEKCSVLAEGEGEGAGRTGPTYPGLSPSAGR